MAVTGIGGVKIVIFVILVWQLVPAQSHPNCVEPVNGSVFPPRPDPPLTYCASYGTTSDGACCTAVSEIEKAQTPASTLINFADTDIAVAACAAEVKKIYCTWCHPYAGHIFESENGAGHRAGPWLCEAYCGRFWTKCANVPLDTSGPGTVGSTVLIPGLDGSMGVTTLADHFASQAAYCGQYASGNPGACFTDNPQELVTIPGGASIPIAVELAYPNLVFDAATVPVQDPAWSLHIVHLIAAPETTRIFASFQHGVILSWTDSADANAFNVVLDIQSTTHFDNGGGAEYGVMGVGFHPHFLENGWMYIKHSHQTNRDRLVRYTVNVATWTADPGSMLVLLDYEMFGVMHHGAPPVFGSDGLMYIANGDGTNYFDNGKDYNPARDPLSLLGKILRLNVDNSAVGAPYAIPADNPFVGNAAWAPEIWAHGFRNPWRMTYDTLANRFWLGSVGQTMFEGVWVAEAAKFHGWHKREAFNCYWPTASLLGAPFLDCVTPDEVLPVFEFPHDQGYCAIASDPVHCTFPAISGNAVIGGYVYRGSKNPSIYGTYIFGNYQPNFEAWVYTMGFDAENPHNIRFVWRLGFIFPASHDPNNWSISTLGLDSQGEILVVNINNPNEILKFKPDSELPPSASPTAGPTNQPTATPVTPSTPEAPSTPSGNIPTTRPTSAPLSSPSVAPSDPPSPPQSSQSPASDARRSAFASLTAVWAAVAALFGFCW